MKKKGGMRKRGMEKEKIEGIKGVEENNSKWALRLKAVISIKYFLLVHKRPAE